MATAAERALKRLARPVATKDREALGLGRDYENGEGVENALVPISTAIRTRHVLRLLFQHTDGRETARNVWPIAVVAASNGRLLAAHCQLRSKYRHFRLDRMIGAHVGKTMVPQSRRQLFNAWSSECA